MPKTVPALPGIEAGALPVQQGRRGERLRLPRRPGRQRARAGTAPCPGGIEAETRQMLDNVGRLLRAVGLDYGDVVKATVYLRDFGEFAAMNGVYREFFPTDPPTRATVGVTALAVRLPGRDRGDRRPADARRRASRQRTTNSSMRDHRVAGRARATSIVSVCGAGVVASVLLKTATCAAKVAPMQVDGLDDHAVDRDPGLAAGRPDRAVPGDLRAGEGQRRGGAAPWSRIDARRRRTRRDGPSSTCPCT